MPPCRAGAALPGRFAETLDSCPPTGQLDFFFTVVPPQDNWKLFFKVVGLDDNLDIFFAGKNSPWRGLGRASMPGRWRGREAPTPGRNVLESISGTCAFEVPRTGNRHQPFFGCCPRGVRNWKQACPIFSEGAWSSAWSSQSWGDNRIEGGNPGVTTGLKEAVLG